ncbi:hypothetical protein PF011_g32908 [Phytophthora fragariae]|uniref:Uncharacterized protein n=1 Tax=Phytophthora fragariae TaxID=53985 RepID=A0A6A3GCF1_9STRA|nr:hypothetical protein PF011_g32908 [Phytophthora fragariae]
MVKVMMVTQRADFAVAPPEALASASKRLELHKDSALGAHADGVEELLAALAAAAMATRTRDIGLEAAKVAGAARGRGDGAAGGLGGAAAHGLGGGAARGIGGGGDGDTDTRLGLEAAGGDGVARGLGGGAARRLGFGVEAAGAGGATH